MILGAQISLAVYGIILLIRGQYSLGKGRKVIGSKAGLLGAVCLLLIPPAMAAGFVIGFANPDAPMTGQLARLIAGIEAAILVCILALAALVMLGKKFYRQQVDAEAIGKVTHI